MKMAGTKVRLLAMLFAFSSCWPLCAYGQDTHPREVLALQAIRRDLQDPLYNLWNWKKKTDPCMSKWNGVICFWNQTDGHQHVQELRLLRYNLSGTLAPELGELSFMTILDFMWNNISGSIPKEIGNITALQFLLLSGNQISGPLPDELGSLPYLIKFQLDLNYISGPIPESFANLPNVKHFHMNNNSISGQIPPGLSKLPLLVHFLLDNNNLSGFLPPELSQMKSLTILQLDNNNFEGSVIPNSYRNMSKLLKLSLRNCSLRGAIPDLSTIQGLLYLDLSRNQFMGNIPSNKLSDNITTIDLSNNQLNGSIPSNFSGFLQLQKLSLNNNSLSGSVPSTLWENRTFRSDETLKLDFQNNKLSDIAGILNPPSNVTMMLSGNPVCSLENGQNISLLCGSDKSSSETPERVNKTVSPCPPQACPTSDYFEYVPALLPDDCSCALPFGVGLRLRSPSISDFPPYRSRFETYITTNVEVNLSQLDIDSIAWENRRLRMYLKFFPPYNGGSTFSNSEVQRIANKFATFNLNSNDIFGPYDLLNFTLHGPYTEVFILFSKGGLSKGALAGIVLGSISIGILLMILLVCWRKHLRSQDRRSKSQSASRVPIKIEGVKAFSFKELETATSSFSISSQVGRGGYGKVYKGLLADGMVVAIKRAAQGSLQREKEFYTEIEILSRLHHRNLVSLVGYCDEMSEQMLVYEFMPGGSVHDLLSARYGNVNFATRLNVALGAARGILYLHTEADPPIIHRDIKANNILLDSKYTAKVSDFGISKLAPLTDENWNTTSHVTTAVKGTPGYLDPEYFLTHKVTEKSDVYSLGIVLLELLTGMQPISHGRNIVREVKVACESGMMFSIIDGRMGACPSDSVKKFMELALRCSQDDSKDRPLMLEVVREIENICSALQKTDASTSEMSASSPSTSYPRKSPYVSMDFPGSDLDSGVVPNIKPR